MGKSSSSVVAMFQEWKIVASVCDRCHNKKVGKPAATRNVRNNYI